MGIAFCKFAVLIKIYLFELLGVFHIFYYLHPVQLVGQHVPVFRVAVFCVFSEIIPGRIGMVSVKVAVTIGIVEDLAFVKLAVSVLVIVELLHAHIRVYEISCLYLAV